MWVIYVKDCVLIYQGQWIFAVRVKGTQEMSSCYVFHEHEFGIAVRLMSYINPCAFNRRGNQTMSFPLSICSLGAIFVLSRFGWSQFMSVPVSTSLTLRKQVKCSILVRSNRKTVNLNPLPHRWSCKTKCSVKTSPVQFGNLIRSQQGTGVENGPI